MASPGSSDNEGPLGSISNSDMGLTLHVRAMSGEILVSVTVSEQAKVAGAQHAIAAASGIPLKEQSLVCGTRRLEAGEPLVAALRGGDEVMMVRELSPRGDDPEERLKRIFGPSGLPRAPKGMLGRKRDGIAGEEGRHEIRRDFEL
eukprot:TRINITY_DN9376_c0_g2_i1.p1 TRINITY_DN9376_c0_g2~~TRINITY_DN9376_c0_g2_i1.p1  ORF type:complete len:165 (+),score=23.72 TRINITY_DN9376_c0_g2_i1:59-496(+)